MLYSDRFKAIHANLAPDFPIEHFASILEPAAIGLSTKQEFFAPVQFSIQVRGKTAAANGALRLNVPVYANENWLTELKERISKMAGLPSGTCVELKTVTRKPLSAIPEEKLNQVGKLFMYVNDKPLLLETMPSVPIEYSMSKEPALHKWFDGISDGLSEEIADLLFKKDVHEVDAAIRTNGDVQTLIERRLQSNLNGLTWPEFVRRHHLNSPPTANAKHADAVLKSVSGSMLNSIRSYIGAAKTQLKRHIGIVKAQKTVVAPTGMDAPVLGANDDMVISGSMTDGHAIYQRLATDALATPTLRDSVINSLYVSTMLQGSQPAPPRRVATTTTTAISDHHPWNAQIHHTLLPLRGSYPSDYIARHTRQDMTPNAPYIGGDVGSTYYAYHLLSGQHLTPPGMTISKGRIVTKVVPISEESQAAFQQLSGQHLLPPGIPVGRGHGRYHSRRPRQTRSQERDMESAVPELVECHRCSDSDSDNECAKEPAVLTRQPIDSQVPDLEPIEGWLKDKWNQFKDWRRRRKNSSSGSSSDDEQTQASVKASVPDLIPLVGDNFSSSEDEKDMGASIGKGVPDLIPLVGCHCSSSDSGGEQDQTAKASIGLEVPELEPIEGRTKWVKRFAKKGRKKRFGQNRRDNTGPPFAQSSMGIEVPDLIPLVGDNYNSKDLKASVGKRVPDLIPLVGCECNSSGSDSGSPTTTKASIGKRVPDPIPLVGCGCESNENSSSDPDSPPGSPTTTKASIGQNTLPRPLTDTRMAKNMPSIKAEMRSRLLPIAAPEPVSEEEVDAAMDDFPHLPKVSDIFK